MHNYVVTKEANEVFLSTKIVEILDLYITENLNERQAIMNSQLRFARGHAPERNEQEFVRDKNFGVGNDLANNNKSNKEKVRCYNCQGMGHIANNCKKLRIETKQYARTNQILLNDSFITSELTEENL